MISRQEGRPSAEVTFVLPASAGASSASLCGEFNDWSPSAHPMTRLEDGSYRITVALTPGRRWRFRYLLDGHRWENDWGADDYEANVYGGQDSVVDLREEP